MTELGHISSLVVVAWPDRVEEVTARISDMDGAEVAMTGERGRIIVTLETPDDFTISERLNEIQTLDHVVSASLVFHHTE